MSKKTSVVVTVGKEGVSYEVKTTAKLQEEHNTANRRLEEERETLGYPSVNAFLDVQKTGARLAQASN